MFVQEDGPNLVVLIVYVDELRILSKNLERVEGTKDMLRGHQFFLGVKFERCGRKMHLNQGAYTEGVLRKFGMAGSAPAATQMQENYDGLVCGAPLSEEEQRTM